MSELQSAGQVDIQEATIVLLDKSGIKQTESIIDMIAQVNIIEDLFEGPVTCSVVLAESKGALTRFNKKGFQGQEFLFLRLKKPGDSGVTSLSQQFWIYDVTDIEFNTTNDTASLTLNCISKEKIIDVYSSVNKAFNGTYSDAAKSIFENQIVNSGVRKKYLKDYGEYTFDIPKLNIHESPAEQKFIIPGKQPFEAIEFCMRRIFGRTGGVETSGNFFTFYELCNGGYNFHNVENLIDEGKKRLEADEDGDYHFEMAPMADKTKNVNFDRKIKEFSDIKTTNNLENANGGVLKNKVRTVDMVGKTYFDIEYDYKTKFNQFRHLGSTPLIDDDYVDMFAQSNYEFLVLKDTTKENQFYEYVVGHRLPYISVLHNLQCSFSIDGDFKMKPGVVLNLRVPEISATTENPAERFDTKFSGNWLISRVSHSFNKNQHSTSVSLLKDSLIEAIGD